jgi:hypothetical protein
MTTFATDSSSGIFGDDVAIDLLSRLYPSRRTQRMDRPTSFANGGVVRCITQQRSRVGAFVR